MKVEQLTTLSHQKIQPFTSDQESSHHQTQNCENLIQNFSYHAQESTTYHIQSLQADIKMRSVYLVNKNLLEGTKITPNIRARIRGFIMEQCAKQWITRETCTLACTLIDLYLFKKGLCEVQEIQTMAISCLMLARKLQEGKLPTISFHIFGKESLLQWEKKVAKKLEYQLYPPTYLTFAEHIVNKWDFFTSNEQQFSKKFGECESGVNTLLRNFYQKLDCLFLVLQVLKWDLQAIVMNMFYLNAFCVNLPNTVTPDQLSDQQFVALYYSEVNQFKQFFIKFLSYYSEEKNLKLDTQIGTFLRLFFALKGSKKEFTALNSQPMFKSLRIWDKLQTYTKQTYQLAKSIMQKIKKK